MNRSRSIRDPEEGNPHRSELYRKMTGLLNRLLGRNSGSAVWPPGRGGHRGFGSRPELPEMQMVPIAKKNMIDGAGPAEK